MYAVGHFALGYVSAKIVSKSLDLNLNLPLVFLLSVLPDIDILIPGMEHRGPFHSLAFCCILFVPIFVVYKKKSLPYFVALLQHSLIGDLLTGGTQLFWPASFSVYGLDAAIEGLPNIALEWIVFVAAITVMYKSKDLLELFSKRSFNLILSVPLLTVLLPSIVTFPLYIPWTLIVPHLVFLIIFVYSLLVNTKSVFNKN